MSVEEIIEKFKGIRHRATQALPERLDEESEMEETAMKLWDDVKDVRDLAKEIMNLVQPEIFEILGLVKKSGTFVFFFVVCVCLSSVFWYFVRCILLTYDQKQKTCTSYPIITLQTYEYVICILNIIVDMTYTEVRQAFQFDQGGSACMTL